MTHRQGSRSHRRRKALVNGLEGGGRDARDGVDDHVATHCACRERVREASARAAKLLLCVSDSYLPTCWSL